MPFPRSSLELIIIPEQKDYLPTLQAEKKFLQVAQKQRWINNFSAGPSAQEFILNGFASIRIERHEYPVLFANHQGGYRVRCPNVVSILKRISTVMTKYRKDRSFFPFIVYLRHPSLINSVLNRRQDLQNMPSSSKCQR